MAYNGLASEPEYGNAMKMEGRDGALAVMKEWKRNDIWRVACSLTTAVSPLHGSDEKREVKALIFWLCFIFRGMEGSNLVILH